MVRDPKVVDVTVCLRDGSVPDDSVYLPTVTPRSRVNRDSRSFQSDNSNLNPDLRTPWHPP